ncbi:HlyD family secretion protein [Mucilaginibacter sp. SP1R1]|uniref:HlyD family secretion protein n=1 Tax=Mucilaginibacter sp. SP1R1 TaxID=2723091 RepID=UPI00160DF8A5|nr:HlyD family efflux transporter periplasmic adaptor subunit [Mucilaginibacter sp. SP1R1]MBB6151929.1 HlyD family secretion protein [Mucilaginibacter sp. SP1R1]
MSITTFDPHNAINYKYQINTRSKILYAVVLVSLMLCIGSLPYFHTKISIAGTGILQSSFEHIELQVPSSGRLMKLNMFDNQKLKKGDTLMVIDAALPREQNDLLQTRVQQLNTLLSDIDVLLRHSNTALKTPNPNLKSGQYNASWQQYIQELQGSEVAKEQAESTFKRYDILYQNKVLTAAEYEKYKFELEQAKSAFAMIGRRYNAQWQVDANQYRNELRQLQSQQADINDQKKHYILKSPISGSLQNLTGLQTGAFVFANQKVAEISPDTNLLAFCYIKPTDIGLIHKGQQVRFQIDAFNYNQWGLLTGKVIDISDDIIVLNNNVPVFKVKCSLDKSFLQLKNGYKGYLKKGMSFSSRFAVTERSLYQLLYDKVDDWVNPNIISK